MREENKYGIKRISDKMCKTTSDIEKLYWLHNELIGMLQCMQDLDMCYEALTSQPRFYSLDNRFSYVLESLKKTNVAIDEYNEKMNTDYLYWENVYFEDYML